MVTILVISDVHANLEALYAVFDACSRERITYDVILNLGDLVGYGADPNAVVEHMRKRKVEVRSVLGNHDYAAITGDVSGFNPHAAEAALWTRGMLSEENKRFLTRLPVKDNVTIGRRRICIVHGSPADPLNEYVFPNAAQSTLEAYLQSSQCDMLLLGHTHVGFQVKVRSGGVVLNPGSVGQPRDGDPAASFVILTEERDSLRIEVRRIGYDVNAAAEKIISAGLPTVLGMRLFEGW
ncbi:MAG: metallophosphoesterase family protein [Candidatus Bathyarchaeia archaeon]